MSATSSKLKNPNDSVMNQRVIKLAWPIFLQLLLGISLGYVDTIMLSNYNETAVGAIGNANQVLGFLTLAFNIISSATGIIVSQYLGAGKKEKMNMIYTVALSFNLVLSIVISFVVFIFSRNLLEAMQVPAAMLDESDMYMRIVGGTIFTQALINAFNSIFASNGKTVFGMIIGLGMNIINICGNALLLYGPLQVLGLGASGAAVSTCGSRVIAVIASVIYFYTVIKGKFSLKYLRPFPYDVLKSLLKLGIHFLRLFTAVFTGIHQHNGYRCNQRKNLRQHAFNVHIYDCSCRCKRNTDYCRSQRRRSRLRFCIPQGAENFAFRYDNFNLGCNCKLVDFAVYARTFHR